MIRFEVATSGGNWRVFAFVEAFSALDVCRTLESIGASERDINECMDGVFSGAENYGFAFSSPKRRASVLCVSGSENLAETINTAFHEIRHVEMHICKTDRIDPFSEDAGYLSGEIMRAVAVLLFG